MSWMDPYERQRALLPTHIVRPPRREEQDWFEYERAWEPRYSSSDQIPRLLADGWEVRRISADDPMEPAVSYEEGEQRRRDHQRQVEAWADEFLTNGRIAPRSPSDREAVLRVAEQRLREVVNDGFLVLALKAREQ